MINVAGPRGHGVTHDRQLSGHMYTGAPFAVVGGLHLNCCRQGPEIRASCVRHRQQQRDTTRAWLERGENDANTNFFSTNVD